MMNYLKKISNTDKLVIALLLGFFFLMVFISFAKWGHPLVDCFRNAYVPDEIIRGKLLYKDIYYFYGPLIVYLHALLFIIFGVNLNVLYFVGIILSLIILFLSYYLSRQLLEPVYAGSLLFIFMAQSVFRPGIYQYIFPYSYETLYGVVLLLGILVCIIELIKQEFKSIKLFYIASIAVCVTTFIKQDIAISAFLLFYSFIFLNLFFKKLEFKKILIPFIIPAAATIIIYWLLTFIIPMNDLIEGIYPINRMNNATVTQFSNLDIVYKLLVRNLDVFFMFAGSVFFPLILIYFGSYYSRKYFYSIKLTIIGVLSLLLVAITVFKINFFELSPFKILFSWEAYTWLVIFLLVYLILLSMARFEDKTFLKPLVQIEFFIALAAIFFLFRTVLNVSLGFYSNMFILPGLIIVWSLICNHLPDAFSEIDNDLYKKSFLITAALWGLLAFLNTTSYYMVVNKPITTDRGTIKLSYLNHQQIKQAIEIIKTNTKNNDVIFAPPEDVIFNFMANRGGASKFYQLLPNVIDSHEDEVRVIKDLKKSKPALVLISTNKNVEFYGKKMWGEDYNIQIHQWIVDNYKLLKTIEAKSPADNKVLPFKVSIYKVKVNF